jgi:UDP-N-acetylmuramoylalanine--D-glutamate ligase
MRPKCWLITGTNGKTTVTSLTGQLVARSGQIRGCGWQHWPHTARHPGRASYEVHVAEVWVLELSSFQLDGVTGFEPTAATVLNITQDHLDWHGSHVSLCCKPRQRVFGSTSLMILNREDLAGHGHAAHRRRLSWWPSQAHAAGMGVWCRHATTPGRLWHRGGQRHGMAGACAGGRRNPLSQKAQGGEEEELHIQRLMPADACASAAATTPSMRWRRWRWPALPVVRWRPCCMACASTAVSRTVWSGC